MDKTKFIKMCNTGNAIILVLLVLANLGAFVLTSNGIWITNALLCVFGFEFYSSKVVN